MQENPSQPNTTPAALQGERIYLREYMNSDFEEWANLRKTSKDFLAPWEPSWEEENLTQEHFESCVDIYQKLSDNSAALYMLIFKADDHKMIGALSLTNVRWGMYYSGTLGYWIGEPYAQKGYMRAALETFIPFLHHTLGVRRLEASTLPNNERSLNLLYKLGFQLEGTTRQSMQIAGEYKDHLLLARLATDN